MDFNKLVEFISHYTPNIILGIVIFISFWVFSKIIQYGIKKILARVNPETNVLNVISSIIKNLIVIIGFITALGTIGINVSAIIAGLGLSGFALGYALKDSISNLLSGILILLYKPFEVNNDIVIGDHEGKIKHIDLRYTTLINNRDEILIPNSKMFTDPITIKNKWNHF